VFWEIKLYTMFIGEATNMLQSKFNSVPETLESSAIVNPLIIIKSMGDKEPYDRNKLKTAISKAVGFSNVNVINEIVNFVESKIFDFDITSIHYEITTGYINALVEGYIQYKATNDKKYSNYLNKYVYNKIKKQTETATKISHLHSIIKNGRHISFLKKFTANQTQIAAARYLLRDLSTGDIKESIEEWFDRVASYVIIGSVIYDSEIYDVNGDYNVNGYTEWFDMFDKLNIKNLKQYQIDLIKHVYNRNMYHMKYDLATTIQMIDDNLLHKYTEQKERYENMMYNGIFLPNTPTLLNAGSGSGGLSACFTLDVEDNMTSITNVQSSSAFIFKMAGGLGVNISKIRPRGEPVLDTFGAATGPINLVLEAIDHTTEIVKSGGKRRGANMGIMEYWHPQILEFIDYKLQTISPYVEEAINIIKASNHPDKEKLIEAITPPGKLLNFNISVMFDDKFWKYYFDDMYITLLHNDKVFGSINAKELIKKIADNAWKSAEPGVLFKDNINRKNPLKEIWGDIHITNPCSEQAMYSGESCTLGSINLAKFVDCDIETGKPIFNFKDFMETVHITTRFLNDVLEVNKYPTSYIEEKSNKTKRIGLGIMGFADMLFKMCIRFNSEEAYDLTKLISNTLYWESIVESKKLALERGPCESFLELLKSDSSPEVSKKIVDRVYNEKTFQSSQDVMMHLDKGVRNAWTTTIAPTGTIAMIAGCSNGLEPVFALVYKKTVSTGDYYYLNTEFQKALVQEGIYTDDIIKKVSNNYGSCQGIDEIPPWIQETFVTAMDLHWLDHLTSQAIWQQNIDNSISKTINMPHNATTQDILRTYVIAHELGLKGVSVYRDGSRDKQIMHTNTTVTSNNGETIGVKAIVDETIKKNSRPSETTIQFLKENINNPQVLEELEKTVFNIDNNDQIYTKIKESCPYCEKGVLIQQAACLSCNICGFSPSCAIG
jgi:ribonucleoside-diphosphate reductase alpha chain